MKKGFIVLALLLFLVGCVQIVTPTPSLTATPLSTSVMTATQIEKTLAATGTNTPNPTVTPFILPSATVTLPATPTQLPTSLPECVSLPCGPNHFFNGGFEGQTTHRDPNQNENILTAPSWNFEYLTGTSQRNPEYQLDVPESGDRKGEFYSNRVDGYTPGVNDQSAVWFKSYGITDAGMTQALDVLEGHCYAIGASVSTWANPDGNSYDGRPFFYSKLSTEDDKKNVEWSIRANFNGGSVYAGDLLGRYGYNDGVYDFIVGPDGKEYFAGKLLTHFCAPNESDNDNVVHANFGFTANNMWRWGNTDYHIDNAFLYCLDCGFGNPLPTEDPNATPTQIVIIGNDYKFVTVVVDSLRVRRGASIDSPLVLNSDGSVKRVLAGEKLPVFTVYQNVDTEEIWARIDDPNVCLLLNMCDDSEWIAVQNPVCSPNDTCAILGND